MLYALLIFIVAVLSGTILTYVVEPDATPDFRLAAGTTLGLTLLGLIGFALACWQGLTHLTCGLASVATAVSFTVLFSKAVRAKVTSDIVAARTVARRIVEKPSTLSPQAFAYVACAILLVCFFTRAVYERDGAIYTGSINNVGDLPLHTSISSSFLYGQNYSPEHPQFAGARLSYPFIADFLTALLMRSGASLSFAMFLISFALALAVVSLAYHWAWRMTGTRTAAVISVMLLLLSGGFGFWLLADDVRRNHGSIVTALQHLSHEYTTEAAHGLRWGNLLETIFLPQRSFQLGLPLALLVWTLWWQAVNGNTFDQAGRSLSMRRMVAAGFVLSLLPLVHTATFLVMATMAGCLALLFWNWRLWLAFFCVLGVVAVPQLLWFSHDTAIHARNVFGWQFGWDRGHENAWWFWLKNTGLFIPLLGIAVALQLRRNLIPLNLLRFYLPFVLCFIVPNVVRLVPWIWDNIKALMFWYIASVPIVALLLAHLWRSKNVFLRSVMVLCLIILTLAGILDVWRVISRSSDWAVFDKDAVECARLIRRCCAPRSLVLHAPSNNDPVYLTGRRSLLSVAFMAWAHGLDLGSREADIARIYSGAPDAAALLKRYGVDYIVVSPTERQRFRVNESLLRRYNKIGETRGCQLYAVTTR